MQLACTFFARPKNAEYVHRHYMQCHSVCGRNGFVWKIQKRKFLKPQFIDLDGDKCKGRVTGYLVLCVHMSPIRTYVISHQFRRFFYWDVIARIHGLDALTQMRRFVCICTLYPKVCGASEGKRRSSYLLLLLPLSVWPCPANWLVLRTSCHILCHRLLFLSRSTVNIVSVVWSKIHLRQPPEVTFYGLRWPIYSVASPLLEEYCFSSVTPRND